MYSACAHMSGMGEPVGRPRNIRASGRSGAFQICSGRSPAALAKRSIAWRYGAGSRPAASS